MQSEIILCSCKQHCIDILNFCSDEEICHSVVVLEGILRTNTDCSAAKIVKVERVDGAWTHPSVTTHHIARNLRFKCLLKLEHGINRFILKYCTTQQDFILNFKPRQTEYCVLPVYIIFKGHDGRFQAPEHEDNSIESACDRIDIGIRLLQSVTAERLREGGFGRRTFQLQSDLDQSVPCCNVFYSQILVEDAHAADNSTLWQWLGRELMTSSLGMKNFKFVAFLSSTLYKGELLTKQNPTHADIVQCTQGHVALGGGGLALFGTGCLHSWAASLEEVVPRLSSTEPVDTALFMDDSNFRGTYGGCFSTTLGAVCHEIGHIFDLGHTTHGIMGSNYHNLQSMFLQDEVDSSTLLAESSKDRQLSCLLTKESREHFMQGPAEVKNVLGCDDGLLYPDKTSTKSEVLVKELIMGWNKPEIHLLSSAKPSPLPSNLSLSQNIQGKDNVESLNFSQPMWDRDDYSKYWAQSCLVLLAHNKWINPYASQEDLNGLTFETDRKHISSKFGIRIVDVRDKNSKSLFHWKYRGDIELSEFTIPKRYLLLPQVNNLCIIDSVGQVIKVELSK